jgi:hypothetical protein
MSAAEYIEIYTALFNARRMMFTYIRETFVAELKLWQRHFCNVRKVSPSDRAQTAFEKMFRTFKGMLESASRHSSEEWSEIEHLVEELWREPVERMQRERKERVMHLLADNESSSLRILPPELVEKIMGMC